MNDTVPYALSQPRKLIANNIDQDVSPLFLTLKEEEDTFSQRPSASAGTRLQTYHTHDTTHVTVPTVPDMRSTAIFTYLDGQCFEGVQLSLR
jgi:hypothetical protein